MQHILVVDNDPLQCRTAELTIQRLFDGKVTSIQSGQEAIDLLLGPNGKDINAVLLDMVMPEVSGLDVLRKVKPARPDLPIIIHTAHGEVDAAVNAMAEGAADFIEKKDGPERLKVSLQNAMRMTKLRHEVERLQRSADGQIGFADIIGDSLAINDARKLSQQASESTISVLLKGESGVGKELFARAIHGSSSRSNKPFIPVNCGAIPENLVESVLFGHEKGAFTGAIEKSMGKFREADGGTLFLDEVGELQSGLQVKLLRALQEGEVEPVGSSRSMKVDVRVISATNRSLKDDVASGKFREDLFYRLNVFPIEIPPLRDRKGDVAQLLDYFVQRISLREGKAIRGLTQSASKILNDYAWPGNIRQLQNAVYRAVVLSDTEWLDVDAFEPVLQTIERPKTQLEDAPAGGLAHQRNDSTLTQNGMTAGKAVALLDEQLQLRSMDALEKDILALALNHCNHRISDVARKLKIGRSTLYRKMEEYGLRD